MYNHLIMFADESSAQAALPDYCRAGRDNRLEWDMSRVTANQRVIISRAVYDMTDFKRPVVVSPEIAVPGWFITVTLPEISTALCGLPNDACRLIGDSETGGVVYAAPDLDLKLMHDAILEPMPAGANQSWVLSQPKLSPARRAPSIVGATAPHINPSDFVSSAVEIVTNEHLELRVHALEARIDNLLNALDAPLEL